MRIKNIIRQLTEESADPTADQMDQIVGHLVGDSYLSREDIKYLSYLSSYLQQIGVYKKPSTSIVYRGLGLKDDEMLRLLDFEIIKYSPQVIGESWTTDINIAKTFMYENSVLIQTSAHRGNVVIQFSCDVIDWLIDKSHELDIEQEHIEELVGDLASMNYENQSEVLLKRQPNISFVCVIQLLAFVLMEEVEMMNSFIVGFMLC